MGTRGLLGFIVAGKRFGSFNQYDSYPFGLGAEVVAFLLSLNNAQMSAMTDRVSKLDGAITRLPDKTDFYHNAVLCEFAYFMDFEKRNLIYCGGPPVDDEGDDIETGDVYENDDERSKLFERLTLPGEEGSVFPRHFDIDEALMGGRINPEEYCALKPILDQYPTSDFPPHYPWRDQEGIDMVRKFWLDQWETNTASRNPGSKMAEKIKGARDKLGTDKK